MKKYIYGSNAFFKNIKGFIPHDNDFLIFVSPDEANFKFMKRIIKPDEELFVVILKPKYDLIKDFIKLASPLSICTFLVPDIVRDLLLELSDLELLRGMRNLLFDTRHEYLGIIYDAYIENDSFTLTEELLNRAYESYKKARNL